MAETQGAAVSARIWDWLDDFVEASGGVVGVLMGFVLPLIAMGLAIWVLTHGTS
jgi:hypothetical protein